MSELRTKSEKLVQTLKRHPYWPAIGAIGLAGIFDAFERARSIALLLQGWLGPDWLTIIISGLYFKVFCLSLIILSLWRIEKKAVRAATRAVRSEAAVRDLTLRPVLDAIRYVAQSQRMDSARKLQAQLEEALLKARQHMVDFENSLPMTLRADDMEWQLNKRMTNAYDLAAEYARYYPYSRVLPQPAGRQHPTMRDVTPPGVTATGRSPAQTFEIRAEGNAKFFVAWEAELAALETFSQFAAESIQATERANATLLSELFRKMDR